MGLEMLLSVSQDVSLLSEAINTLVGLAGMLTQGHGVCGCYLRGSFFLGR